VRNKRPCSECRRWFVPDPRVGDRGRSCGASECMRKRRARTNRRWRAANPSYDPARRLSEKLAAAAPAWPRAPAPLGRVAWDVVQAEMGSKPSVILGDLVRVPLRAVQAEMRRQIREIKAEVGRVARPGAQAEIGAAP